MQEQVSLSPSMEDIFQDSQDLPETVKTEPYSHYFSSYPHIYNFNAFFILNKHFHMAVTLTVWSWTAKPVQISFFFTISRREKSFLLYILATKVYDCFLYQELSPFLLAPFRFFGLPGFSASSSYTLFTLLTKIKLPWTQALQYHNRWSSKQGRHEVTDGWGV